MAQALNIVFIGCGNMGRAILDGFLSAQSHHTYTVIKPSPIDDLEDVHYFSTCEAGASALKSADIIILAVKPQIMHEVMESAAPRASDNALILSIAAGIKIETYAKYFAKNPIIRCLPNTPSAVGKGMNILIANAAVSGMQKNEIITLFDVLGKTHWLEDETDMDAGSAISASGPAYVFYVIEALAKAGENMGLPADISMTLARQTVIGAAALAEESANTPASKLRENVTSAKGMTQAALDVFMNGDMQKIFNKALKAGRDRSKELGA